MQTGWRAGLAVTTLLQVPHAALRQAARRHPAIAEAFWRECVVDAAVLSGWMVNVGRRNAKAQAALLLCEMACRYELGGTDVCFSFDFPATQAHLADMLALTPVHVNRTLKTLREEGLADIRSRTVHVLDWDGIVAAGEFDPSHLQIPPAWSGLGCRGGEGRFARGAARLGRPIAARTGRRCR